MPALRKSRRGDGGQGVRGCGVHTGGETLVVSEALDQGFLGDLDGFLDLGQLLVVRCGQVHGTAVDHAVGEVLQLVEGAGG